CIDASIRPTPNSRRSARYPPRGQSRAAAPHSGRARFYEPATSSSFSLFQLGVKKHRLELSFLHRFDQSADATFRDWHRLGDDLLFFAFFLSQIGEQLLGLTAGHPHFPLRCDKSVTVNLRPSSRIQGQSQGGVAMKKRMVIAFFATSLTAGASFAADWPLMGPQLYPSAPRMAVDWTGIYFGANAGYGWAQGSSNTVFGGGATNTLLAATGLVIPAGATTPLGLGATELGGTALSSSSSPRGGIAGGQIGFNWQAGMVVFGAELDAQWSGQSNAVSLICTPPRPGCTATEAI